MQSKSDSQPEAKRAKVEQGSDGGSSKILVEEVIVKNILESMDVSFHPSVLPQLVECMHRFTEDVLAEAHDYATHASRKTTEIIDLRLALQTRSLTESSLSRQVVSLFHSHNVNIDHAGNFSFFLTCIF
jgi:histone H3/H4